METTTPAQITWSQISLGVKMRLGVRGQSIDNNGRSLVMNVGPNRSRYQVWVTLNGYDLYDVTLFKGKNEVWQALDVYNDQLNEVLVNMESTNWG